jgi:putative ABC transport system permease protein
MESSAWRHAWRSLRHRPAFLAAAVVTLGFGAAVTTAVFSLVDTVLIRPLPYPDADRLVTVFESSPAAREKTSLVAPVRLRDWNQAARTFVALSGSYSENVTDTSGDLPERLEGIRVAARFFNVFGMTPRIGRTFTAEEEGPQGPGAAVISERFWRRRFNADASALERSLTIGGRPYRIVGVMPAAFTAAKTDVWLPAQFGEGMMRARRARFLRGIGRIRPHATFEEAAQDLTSVQAALAREHPGTDAGWSTEIRPLKEARIGTARRGLVLLLGAVALLWVIAIGNIAGLTLVQMRRRTRELAIRAALGASRARVVGTVVREGIIIALLGGAVGGAAAAWMISAMPAVLSNTPRINEVGVDARAFAFVAVTSLLAAITFSLVPALAGTRRALAGALSGTTRSVAGGSHRVQKGLVVGQVALSVLLVGSATLLLRTYYDLTHADTGFDASQTVTFHVGARWDEDRVRIGRLQQQLMERLEQLPHVEAVGMTNFLPATGATLRYQVHVDGLAGSNADGSINVGARMINGRYFQALHAPLVAGSWCATPPAGDFTAARSAMVNRRFVDTHAAGQNVTGRSVRILQGGAPYTIAGVIGDIAEDGHASGAAPYLYTCDAPGAWPDPEYVARTSDARAFAADLRAIVRELDATRAVFGLRPLQDVLDAALDQPRLDAALVGFFAAAALLLAAIGLYSLFMLIVAERVREIAVRLAIGAAPRGMFALVMSDAARLLAGGLVAGLALTLLANRALRALFTGMSPLDVTAVGVSTATLIVVGLCAVALPALKASRVDPIHLLRTD